MEETKEFDCLLSYCRADAELARPLCSLLQAQDVSCWIDVEQVLAGDNWAEKIPPAMDQSRCVVIAFGPSGPGKSQMEEWQYLYRECVERGKRFIPVQLPGGTIPRQLGLHTRTAVEFPDRPENCPAEIEQLRAAIETHATGAIGSKEFEILIDVESSAPACCLAMPFDCDAHLAETLVRAISNVHAPELMLIQTNDASHAESFDADVVAAVRRASVVLADLTLRGPEGLPDPSVTFQAGLAVSLGKPVVIVTNAPISPKALFKTEFDQLVEYDAAAVAREEPSATGGLAEKIAEALTACLGRLSPPYLARNDQEGIGIARAEIYTMRGVFWTNFHKLQRFGLNVHHAFRHLARTVHALERMADVLEQDVTTIGRHVHHERDWSEFRRAHEQFRSAHASHIAPALTAFLSDGEDLARAFERLKRKTTRRTRGLVERSAEYYTLMTRMLAGYNAASQPVIAEDWLPSVPDIGALIFCLTQVRTLASFVEQVQLQAHEMLMCLLELIGEEPRLGGRVHEHGHGATSGLVAPAGRETATPGPGGT